MIPMLYKSSGLQFTIPTGIAVAQGSCVGGSTVVNDAVCFRAPDAVLGWWADQHKVEDIGPDALKRHYEKVEKRISVSEVQPYELNKNNLVLKRGAEKLGWASAPNSRNCKSCRQCGLCQIGCSYGTKQSMLETYIPDAQAMHGDPVKLYADAEADSVVRSGSRVTGVKATITGREGRTYGLSVKAKLVIVSAGHRRLFGPPAAERPERQRAGRQGGRHPPVAGDGRRLPRGDQREPGNPDGVPLPRVQRAHHGEARVHAGGDLHGPLPVLAPAPGVRVRAQGADVEVRPLRPHRVAPPGRERRDGLARRARSGTILEYQLTPGDSKLMAEGMKSAARALFAAGATKVITSHRKTTVLYGEDDLHIIDERGVSPGAMSIGSGHPQGGNRMGGAGQNRSSTPTPRSTASTTSSSATRASSRPRSGSTRS